MKRLTDLIIYGNFLIAAGAACMVWETYLLFHVIVNPFYIAIAFCATMFVYNIDRLVVLSELKKTGNERHSWIAGHSSLLIVTSGCCLAFLIVSIFFLPVGVILFLAHLGIISVAYSIPLFSGRGKNLRSIKFLKIFLITYVWASSTVLMPAIGAGLPVFQKDIVLLFAERALFIFAITLPFDIRDYKSDIQHNVATIPGLIGIRRTRLLAFLCLVVFLCINFMHYDYHSGVLYAKLLSGISTLAIVWLVRPGRHEYYFTGLLDSTIIIQFLLVAVFLPFHFF